MVIVPVIVLAAIGVASDVVAQDKSETRVFLLDSCPLAGRSEDIFGEVARGFVKAALEVVGKKVVEVSWDALSRKVSTLTAGPKGRIEGRQSNALYRVADGVIKLNFNCIVLVRGKFGQSGPEAFSDGTWAPPERRKRARETLHLAREPLVYLEVSLRMLTAGGTPALEARPEALIFRESFAPQIGVDATRDLTATIVFELPVDASGSTKAFGLKPMLFEKITLGTTLEGANVNWMTGGWLSLAPLQKGRTPANGTVLRPVTITVTIFESGAGRTLFDALKAEMSRLSR